MAGIGIKCGACNKRYRLKAVAEKLVRIPCPNCGEFIKLPKKGKARGLLRTIQATIMPAPGERRPDLPEFLSSVVPQAVVLKRGKRKRPQPHHAAASSLLKSGGTYGIEPKPQQSFKREKTAAGPGKVAALGSTPSDVPAASDPNVWTSAPDGDQTKKVKALTEEFNKAPTAKQRVIPRGPIQSEKPFEKPVGPPKLKLGIPPAKNKPTIDGDEAAAAAAVEPPTKKPIPRPKPATPPPPDPPPHPPEPAPTPAAAPAPPSVDVPEPPETPKPPQPPQPSQPPQPPQTPQTPQTPRSPPPEPTAEQSPPPTPPRAFEEHEQFAMDFPSFAEASEAELRAMSEAVEEELELNALGYAIIAFTLLFFLGVLGSVVYGLVVLLG